MTIDAKKADARNKKHKGYVDGFIVERWGGFAAFNKSVSEAFAAARIQQLFVARNEAAVAGLSGLLAHDSGTARERAVGALSTLAAESGLGRPIWEAPGAGLARLLTDDGAGAREAAAAALRNLAIESGLRRSIQEARVVVPP